MSYKSCPQAFLPYLAMLNNSIIRSCDLDIWRMILIFSGFRAVVKGHVRAVFYPAACSGSWAIVLTEKKTRTKIIVCRYRADRKKWVAPFYGCRCRTRADCCRR